MGLDVLVMDIERERQHRYNYSELENVDFLINAMWQLMWKSMWYKK